MDPIILSAEQSALIGGLTEPVDAYDEQGNLLGRITPVTSRATDAGDSGPFFVPAADPGAPPRS